MRIVADFNRCQGYAQCVPLAPTVPNPYDSLRQVLRAAASCPVQAILAERLDEAGEELAS